MKTKFEQLKDQASVDSSQSDEEDRIDESEVDASATSVAASKGGKMAIIFASIVLTAVVIYFLFFKAEKPQTPEKLEEVAPAAASIAPPSAESFFDDSLKEEDLLLDKSNAPEIPKLPDLPKIDEQQGSSGILPVFLDLATDKPKPNEQQNPVDANLPSQQQTANSYPQQSNIQPNLPAQVPAENPAFSNSPAVEKSESPPDPRRSPIVIIKGAAGPTIGVGYENNIRRLKEEPIEQLKETKSKVVPTIVKDRSTTITQGKIMTAVLETAINTEVPGNVRAIVSRDVYGESGNNVLIPRGSRLYGSYSSKISRGQARIEIDWSRLIRPDGVDIAIAFNASDQFGRAGIEGDIDNKYGSILGNSILTSVLAITGAIAAEKISGDNSKNTTTTDPSTGTTTTTGSASSKAIYDVTKTIIDTVGQVIGNTIDMRPVIRVPQGTRVTIVVNDDINLPPLRNR